MSQEMKERAAVVQEALSWAGTPYHHRARVKGAGVDCGQLLAAVYENAGVVPPIHPGAYPPDWHLHRSEERYLAHVQEHAHQVEAPGPGDIVLFRFGRCISHGAVVVAWPRIVHAYVGMGVVEDDAETNPILASRLAGFWSPWGGAR